MRKKEEVEQYIHTSTLQKVDDLLSFFSPRETVQSRPSNRVAR